MEKKYLILTVGGACAPLVNAIASEKPHFVYFICSGGKAGSHRVVDGPGTPCAQSKGGDELRLPSIVAQTRLAESDYKTVLVDDPDALNECYEACCRVEKEIHTEAEQSGHRPLIIANYTGGTKTMSAALLLYSVHRGWELKCNVGPRQDLIKVRVGDVPMRVHAGRVLVDRHLGMVEHFLAGFHFAEAADFLTNVLSQEEVPRRARDSLIACRNLCLGFNAWDRFEHAEARYLLEPHARHCSAHFVFLKRLLGETKPHTGYEMVEDLIYNARRRAVQQRYDDAVARLYRAVEMLAQKRLQISYGIETSDVDLSKVPDPFKSVCHHQAANEEKIKIGLTLTYQC